MCNFSDFGVECQTSILKNKSKIYLLKKIGSPIHIQACIQAGSRYNSISGQAHFLEHILVAGTKLYPSKLALVTSLEKVGGYFEAITDADLIRLTISVPQTKHIPLAVSILNEMLTNSLYKEEVFHNEQSVILREQKDQLRNLSVLLMGTLMKKVYPDFDLCFNNLGTTKSVMDLQVKDIADFAKTNITAERTSYIISGAVEMQEIESLLSTIELPLGLGNSLPQLQFPINNSERVAYIKQEGENSDILVGFRCDTNTLVDLAGLLLIQQMFTGRGNRLIQELRYKQGLVYGGGTPFWDFNGTSIFGLRTTCATAKLEDILVITLNILKEISTKGISESECENLKVKIDGHYRFKLQTSKEWLDAEVFALRHNIKNDKNVNALTILSLIQQIDANKLTEIFQKYFDPKNAHCVILGSPLEIVQGRMNGLML